MQWSTMSDDIRFPYLSVTDSETETDTDEYTNPSWQGIISATSDNQVTGLCLTFALYSGVWWECKGIGDDGVSCSNFLCSH
jgi:hypothetical protein